MNWLFLLGQVGTVDSPVMSMFNNPVRNNLLIFKADMIVLAVCCRLLTLI